MDTAGVDWGISFSLVLGLEILNQGVFGVFSPLTHPPGLPYCLVDIKGIPAGKVVPVQGTLQLVHWIMVLLWLRGNWGLDGG